MVLLLFFLPKRNLFSRSFGSRSQIRMPAHLGSMKTSRFAEKVLCAQMTSWCVHVVRREKALWCLFFFKLLFCIGAQLINNVVIGSDEQQRDSDKHIHIPSLPPNSPPLQACAFPFYHKTRFLRIPTCLCMLRPPPTIPARLPLCLCQVWSHHHQWLPGRPKKSTL